MTVDGHIENGQIVLHHSTVLPEGMKVRVEFLEKAAPEASAENESPGQLATLYDRMKSFVGSVEGLPSDFAINHDHYLHGQPKRQ